MLGGIPYRFWKTIVPIYSYCRMLTMYPNDFLKRNHDIQSQAMLDLSRSQCTTYVLAIWNEITTNMMHDSLSPISMTDTVRGCVSYPKLKLLTKCAELLHPMRVTQGNENILNNAF